MPKKKQKYQNLIYVELKTDSDLEVFMSAHNEPEEIATMEGDVEVGIYQFVKTAIVRTKFEIEVV